MTSGGFGGLHFTFSTILDQLMWPVCSEDATLRFFSSSCFWIELLLIMVNVNGRSDECVVRLTVKDILAPLWLVLGQQDAWYYRQVNLENWACASFCSFDTVHIQVDGFIVCSWKTGIQLFTISLDCCWCLLVFMCFTYFLYCQYFQSLGKK